MKIKSFLILFFSIFLLNPWNAMAANNDIIINDAVTCSATAAPCSGIAAATCTPGDTYTIKAGAGGNTVYVILCSATVTFTVAKDICVYQCTAAKQILKRDVADAVADTNQNSFTKNACNILRVTTGSAGKTFATFAVIATGIGFFTGKVSWGLMIGVAAGIATMFGGPSIVAAITGQSTDMMCNLNPAQ